MTLPTPVSSHDDHVAVLETYGDPNWITWRDDPIKAAVLHAIFSCQDIPDYSTFISGMAGCLGQNMVCPSFHFVGIKGGALLRRFQEHSRIMDLVIVLKWYLLASGDCVSSGGRQGSSTLPGT